MNALGRIVSSTCRFWCIDRRTNPSAHPLPILLYRTMKPHGSHPALRLVGASVSPQQRVMPRGHTTPSRSVAGVRAVGNTLASATPADLLAVASENTSASLSALDPRWALAVRANSLLQGGRAAILPPESRRLLVSLGSDLRLRTFDSNLIIAIVQDAARAGRDPLGPEAKSRLTMIPPPAEAASSSSVGTRLIGAVLMAGLLVWFLIRAFGG